MIPSRETAPGAHPLSAFGLDMLARGAARLRGDRPALTESGGGASDANALIYRELDHSMLAFGARALECGLAPGERIVIVGAPRVATLTAILGALGAGLEPIIAPLQISAGSLAYLVQTTGATAIFSASSFAGIDLSTIAFDAAAAAQSIRLVGSLGPEVSDGGADFSQHALAETDEPLRTARVQAPPQVGFVLEPEQRAPRVVFLTQSDMIAQSLEIIGHMRATAARPIVSMLSPASVAGFLAGPVAALLAGAPLVFYAPFEAASFLELIEQRKPVHLVAPTSICDEIMRSGLASELESLTLASPFGSAPTRGSFELPCPHVSVTTEADGRLLVWSELESVGAAAHSR